MELRNKTIIILSQQDWGEMFISKNHYALELAKMGNEVFYVPGPERRRGLRIGEIRIEDLPEHQNLHYIDHCLFFPGILKFKVRWLYDFLLRFHVSRMIRQTGKVDVVLSFDLSNTMPLKCFPSSCVKVYMPMDELSEKVAVEAAKTADIIFSITYEILSRFRAVNVPKIFLNHGVSEDFIAKNAKGGSGGPVQVGLSGNLLRPDIDRGTLLQIIKENPDVIFNFWGSTGKTISNITAELLPDAQQFVQTLEGLQNVKLHGSLPPYKLARAFENIDCFLICYDIEKDQSKGTNYHKLLEYIATGKVVVSTNVSTYERYPGIIEMTRNRTKNMELPVLFKAVIMHLDKYNAADKQEARIEFAKQFTYVNQVKKIEAELSALRMD